MKKFMLLLGCAQSLVAGELVFIGRGDAIIHTARLDTNTGALTDLRVAAELPWPSFLAVAPNRRFLYAVSEGPSPEKSWISAFALAPDGALTFLNRQPRRGQRAVPSGAGSAGQMPAGGQLRIGQHDRLSRAAGRLAGNEFGVDPKSRDGGEPGAPGGAARALRADRSGGALCI